MVGTTPPRPMAGPTTPRPMPGTSPPAARPAPALPPASRRWTLFLAVAGILFFVLYVVTWFEPESLPEDAPDAQAIIDHVAENQDAGRIAAAGGVFLSASLFVFAVGLRHALRRAHDGVLGTIVLGAGALAAGFMLSATMLSAVPYLFGAEELRTTNGQAVQAMIALEMLADMVHAAAVIWKFLLVGAASWAMWTLARSRWVAVIGFIIAAFSLLAAFEFVQPHGIVGAIAYLPAEMGFPVWVLIVAIVMASKRDEASKNQPQVGR